MAALDLSTAGMAVGYAISEDGAKPESFINIPNPKSIPDFNPEPSTLDTTSLNATEWKTSINGLKDVGGALGITFGMNQDFVTLWNDSIVEGSKGKTLWIEFYHPQLTDGFFFTAEPAPLGFSSASVDSVWDATANVTPTGNIGWSTAVKPTGLNAQG